ncbi:exopolysaccharide transport family protein [Rhizobium sp. RU36D]|uniref:GumC family protein n=1 Tax=Rhizobium sp. RU36D TaxID=1907415 RepID=UPI0009D8E1E9|nr:exopolysaccharide transport family protein [Rhizobium sp. RU36D]SMD08644.1 exopolysaccharide transport protein family [Rhizobium sp. RU36D]
MSGVSSSQQDVDIDLAGLFRAVWARRTRVLAATVAVTALAFVGANLISPSYKSETRILIEARAPNFTAQQQAGQQSAEPVFDELSIASQVQMLRSVDLIKQVARDLKLYELEEFDPDTNPSALSDLLVLLRLKENPLDMAPEERVLKAFDEKLQVYQVEKSRVIGIQFTSKDPKLSAAIPNAMADVYLSIQSGAKLDSNSDAARWLEPEIANLREKVREAEQKVADYRSSSDLFATSETANFATQQLNDISLELARLRGEKADAEAKAQNVRAALKAGKPTENIDAVAASPVIQSLKQSETDLRRQMSQLSTSLLDGHPQIKAIRAQVTAVREQINTESLRIAAGLEDAAEVAKLRETQLVQQLNVLKADSARAGEVEVGLKDLEREATAQRQLLETYLARYREATTRLDKNASPADARIISQAIEPREQDFPKVLPITIVAALATLILYSVAIMLAELFSGRALSPSATTPVMAGRAEPAFVPATTPEREVEDVPPQPAPVSRRQPAPAAPVKKASRRPVPASLLSEPLDDDAIEAAAVADMIEPEPQDDAFSIASVAGFLMKSRVGIAICISPSGDDGSTATVMLAREIAELGRRVVLIDMTGSACPTRLMAASRSLPGITDLLCGEAAFADTIHRDRLSDAHVIPQGNSDVRRAMSGVDRLSMIADALADAYDLVLIECGPANADGVARMSRSGAHEIVLSAPNPDREELAAIMASFEKVGYSDLILMSETAKPGRQDAVRGAA